MVTKEPTTEDKELIRTLITKQGIVEVKFPEIIEAMISEIKDYGTLNKALRHISSAKGFFDRITSEIKAEAKKNKELLKYYEDELESKTLLLKNVIIAQELTETHFVSTTKASIAKEVDFAAIRADQVKYAKYFKQVTSLVLDEDAVLADIASDALPWKTTETPASVAIQWKKLQGLDA